MSPDEFLTEEERRKLQEKNEQLIKELQQHTLKFGNTSIRISEGHVPLLSVKVRSNTPGKIDEFLFTSGGNIFRKVNTND